MFASSTTEGDLADVVDDGAGGARDDPDRPRLVRERTLSLGCEQPLLFELCLELLERLEESALAGRLDAIADELQTTARRPERGLAANAQPRAVFDERSRARRHARAVEDDVDGRLFLFVFEREVDVAARRGARTAHFAFDPHRRRERVRSSARPSTRPSCATVKIFGSCFAAAAGTTPGGVDATDTETGGSRFRGALALRRRRWSEIRLGLQGRLGRLRSFLRRLRRRRGKAREKSKLSVSPGRGRRLGHDAFQTRSLSTTRTPRRRFSCSVA